MSDELPKGWCVARVRDIILGAQSGFASGEKDVPDGLRHLRMNNIGVNGELVLDLVRTVPPDSASEQHQLERGDVLVCTTNSGKLVGKTAYFAERGRFAFSNHLTRLRPNPAMIDGSFLRWALWLEWRRGSFGDKCKHWVNQSTLPKDELLDTELAVPPLAEQRRIAAKLEQALARIDASKQRLAKIPVLLKRFRQSVLAAACSGRLTADWREANGSEQQGVDRVPSGVSSTEAEALFDVPDSWAWRPLRELCDQSRPICYGVIKLGADFDAGVPCLRTSDVKPLSIDLDGVKRIDPNISSQYTRTVLRGGEVLVNVRGTLGGVAVVPAKLRGWNVSREIAVVPISAADPKYIALCIASVPCQNWLMAVAKGVAYTGINIEDLRQLPIGLPPPPEQHEIVRRVEALFKLADQIEARFAEARAQIDKLTPALLAKAFRGELVPQDPADEPASVLLARIRAERAAAAEKLAPKHRRPAAV